MQPRQFFLLMDRHKERIEHTEYLNGLLASTVANFAFNPPKKPVTPSVFMPSWAEKETPKKQRINRKKIADKLRATLKAAAIAYPKKPDKNNAQ